MQEQRSVHSSSGVTGHSTEKKPVGLFQSFIMVFLIYLTAQSIWIYISHQRQHPAFNIDDVILLSLIGLLSLGTIAYAIVLRQRARRRKREI